MERVFLKSISWVLKKLKVKYSIDTLRIIYALLVNAFQLFFMVLIAYALGVFIYFMIMFFIYITFGNLGEHDHFNALATCFVWSNLLFVPHIFALYFIVQTGGQPTIVAVGLGMVSGVALSKDHLITNWFSYDRSREQINFGRNRVRMQLLERAHDFEILSNVKKLEEITQSDITTFFILKYQQQLTNEVIAQRMNITPAFAKKLDDKLICAFATYF